MQIVIDIDKDKYDDIKRIASVQTNHRTPTVEQIISNGTPLPKGHGRLIDADAVEKEMNKAEVEADRNADYYTADKIDCAMEYLIGAETIIPADGGENNAL